MLEEYERIQTGLARHVIERIDRSIEEKNRHKLDCERREETRKDRGQWAGIILGFFGVSLAATINYLTGYDLVPIVLAIVCVGGPNVATIVARFLDRLK